MQVRRVRANIRVRPYNSMKYFFNSPMLALPKRNALAQMKSYTTQFMGTKTQVARSGWSSAERYFREGMLALPYQLHKFDG